MCVHVHMHAYVRACVSEREHIFNHRCDLAVLYGDLCMHRFIISTLITSCLLSTPRCWSDKSVVCLISACQFSDLAVDPMRGRIRAHDTQRDMTTSSVLATTHSLALSGHSRRPKIQHQTQGLGCWVPAFRSKY